MPHMKLATARKRRGLSRYALAKISGINRTTIGRLERGLTRPEYATVIRLEEALEYPHGTLTFEEAAAS